MSRLVMNAALARRGPLQADGLRREGDEQEEAEHGAVQPVAAPHLPQGARHDGDQQQGRRQVSPQQVRHRARGADRVLDDDEVEAPHDGDREQSSVRQQRAAPAGRGGRDGQAQNPPSTSQESPVTKAASSLARKATTEATSRGLPNRPTG